MPRRPIDIPAQLSALHAVQAAGSRVEQIEAELDAARHARDEEVLHASTLGCSRRRVAAAARLAPSRVQELVNASYQPPAIDPTSTIAGILRAGK